MPRPIQTGDLATRLRRALGLRGDLNYQLSDAPVQLVGTAIDVHDAPYSDQPEYWSAGLQCLPAQVAGHAAEWAVWNALGSGCVVSLDRIAYGYASTDSMSLYWRVARGGSVANFSGFAAPYVLNMSPEAKSPNGWTSEPRVKVGQLVAGLQPVWPLTDGFGFAGILHAGQGNGGEAATTIVLWPGDSVVFFGQHSGSDTTRTLDCSLQGRLWVTPVI